MSHQLNQLPTTPLAQCPQQQPFGHLHPMFFPQYYSLHHYAAAAAASKTSPPTAGTVPTLNNNNNNIATVVAPYSSGSVLTGGGDLLLADSSTSGSSGATTPVTPQQHIQQHPQMIQYSNNINNQNIINNNNRRQQLPRMITAVAAINNSNQNGATAPIGSCVAGGNNLGNGGPRIELANKELWQKFHRVTNEMVVTRTGRKMFPKLELYLRGLDPKAPYSLSLCMRQVDSFRYKYQAGGWSAAGQDDGSPAHSNEVHHHEGLWNPGEFWTSQEKVCFDRVKLTNRDVQSNSLISLCSMHKYQPVVCLYGLNESNNMVLLCSFAPVETQFIAVTAYQSEAVTQLKVEHNPFAKGFREGSSRKRTLSPATEYTTNNSYSSNSLSSSSAGAAPPSAKRPLLCPPATTTALSYPPAMLPFPFLAQPCWPSQSLATAFLASMAASSNWPQQNNVNNNINNSNTITAQLEFGKLYSQWWQQQQLKEKPGADQKPQGEGQKQ